MADPDPTTSPTLLPHLRWSDALLFLVFLIDLYGDALVFSLLVLYLETNFGASGGLARAVKGAIQVTDSVIGFFCGPLLDSWPRDAPLMATTYTKPVGAFALLAFVLVDIHGGGIPSLFHVMLAMALLMLLFCPAEVMGALAPTLTIKRVCETRDARLVRPALYNFLYATGNLCAELSSWTIFATRQIWSDNILVANRAVFIIAMLAFFIVAGLAAPVHALLKRQGQVLPRPMKTTRRDWGWRPGRTAWHDEPLYDPCADWECSVVGCKRLTAGFRRPRLWVFVGFIAALAGTYCVFIQLEDTLPQVMIRRFGLTSTFALFQAINPAILLVLAFAIPFIPWIGRIKVLPRLVLGTLIQAVSPLWASVFSAQEWAVAVFLVQFSLGEALAFPMVSEYAMQLAPQGEEALYSSMATVPRIIGRVSSLALSSALLQGFCPVGSTPLTCSPALIWLFVALIGMLTPLTLGLMWWKKVLK